LIIILCMFLLEGNEKKKFRCIVDQMYFWPGTWACADNTNGAQGVINIK